MSNICCTLKPCVVGKDRHSKIIFQDNTPIQKCIKERGQEYTYISVKHHHGSIHLAGTQCNLKQIFKELSEYSGSNFRACEALLQWRENNAIFLIVRRSCPQLCHRRILVRFSCWTRLELGSLDQAILNIVDKLLFFINSNTIFILENTPAL